MSAMENASGAKLTDELYFLFFFLVRKFYMYIFLNGLCGWMSEGNWFGENVRGVSQQRNWLIPFFFPLSVESRARVAQAYFHLQNLRSWTSRSNETGNSGSYKISRYFDCCTVVTRESTSDRNEEYQDYHVARDLNITIYNILDRGLSISTHSDDEHHHREWSGLAVSRFKCASSVQRQPH